MRTKKFTQTGCRRNKIELLARMFDIYFCLSGEKFDDDDGGIEFEFYE